MDVQQSLKLATLEAKVATLEDEGKINKGEVKQVLTESATAILARDNPFDDANNRPQPAVVPVTAEISRVQIVTPEPAPAEPAHEPAPLPQPRVTAHAEPAPDPGSRAFSFRRSSAAAAARAAAVEPAHHRQHLRLGGRSDDGVLGALRFEILLDLCEAAGHVTAEARAALSRMKELDVPTPAGAPSTNDTVVILRQLDALLNDEYEPQQGFRVASRH